MTRRVVLATRNEHKVHELEQILGDLVSELDLEIVPVTAYPDVADVPETEVTFEGNSLLKARAVAAATAVLQASLDELAGMHRVARRAVPTWERERRGLRGPLEPGAWNRWAR